jgi:hypothetical protein
MPKNCSYFSCYETYDKTIEQFIEMIIKKNYSQELNALRGKNGGIL